MLGAVFHLQHHGRNMLEAEPRLSTGCNCFSAHHLARLRQFVHQPRDLHDIQLRVPQGLQAHTDVRRLNLRERFINAFHPSRRIYIPQPRRPTTGLRFVRRPFIWSSNYGGQVLLRWRTGDIDIRSPIYTKGVLTSRGAYLATATGGHQFRAPPR